MSEQNKAVVRRFLDAFDKGDLAKIAELTDPGYVDHNPMPGQPADLEGLKQLVAAVHAAFPDMRTIIDDMVAEGDKVVVRSTMRGTHKGGFMGMAPTDKQVSVSGIDIMRLTGGMVAEHWGYMDESGMMQQLGAGR